MGGGGPAEGEQQWGPFVGSVVASAGAGAGAGGAGAGVATATTLLDKPDLLTVRVPRPTQVLLSGALCTMDSAIMLLPGALCTMDSAIMLLPGALCTALHYKFGHQNPNPWHAVDKVPTNHQVKCLSYSF
jgi:hypothetical protein